MTGSMCRLIVHLAARAGLSEGEGPADDRGSEGSGAPRPRFQRRRRPAVATTPAISTPTAVAASVTTATED
jgi:hypothetical protein